MKYFYLLLLLFFVQNLSAQVTDDFNDGDFTTNPTWSGDNAKFAVVTNKLNSNSTIAGDVFYLSTPSTQATNAQWELSVNLQYNTSGTNFVDIFLTADNANLRFATLNGYFVRIGGTPDEISLYKKVAGVNTILINGLDGVTNVSNNILKIKITRNLANLWKLDRDITGIGTSYVTEGTVTDNTFSTSAFFGIVITQSTATFFQKHFFDDIIVGNIILDTTPPTIISSQTTANNQLDVLFSETVAQTFAENTANYNVNNAIGTPTTAIRDATNLSLVHLTFAGTFTSGQANTITINNVQDVNGNTILANSTSNFTFVLISIAAQGDIIISEIMADPDPQVLLPNVEYVEIFNRSIKNIDLKNYTLNTKVLTTTSYILAPNSYVLLVPAPSVPLFVPFVAQASSIIGVISFDGLTNTGETITLRDVDNFNDINIVTYSDSWYKDATKKDGGYSLELINPNAPCSAEANWKATLSTQGGTPANQNSVFSNLPDTTAPTLQTLTVNNPNLITITYNEPMNVASLVVANFSASNGLTFSSLNVLSNTKIELNLSSPLLLGTIYVLTQANIRDCSNNLLTLNTQSFGIGSTPQANEVIITEIFPDPDPTQGLPPQEFIEIYNRTTKLVSLDNCSLTDGTSVAKILGINLLPNEYAVICSSTNAPLFTSYGKTIGLTNFPSLSNDGKTLIFQNNLGKTVNTVSYTSDWYKDNTKKDGGWTLELIDLDNPCGEIDNWRASVSPVGGTPAKVNSVKAPNPDILLPILVRADAISSTNVNVIFSERMDSLYLADVRNYSIDGFSVVLAVPQSPDFKRVKITLNNPLLIKTSYKLTVQGAGVTAGARDCAGNLINSLQNTANFGVPELAETGNIILNELLFNPRTGGNDFVELYNNSDKFINLKNYKLSRLNNNIIDPKQTITTEDYVIAPNAYLAVTDNVLNIQNNYPRSVLKPFLQIKTMPSYNDDEGTVLLFNPLDVEIERFFYTDKYHFEILDNKEGVSLERVDFNAPTNEKNTWFSAANTVGFATPGETNSQKRLNGNVPSGGISVEPRAFTPNADGLSDFTTISFNLIGNGNVGTVKLYDNVGRLVRELVNNQSLGDTGSFVWDGLDNKNEKVRTGYYLVLFEVFNTNGNTQIFKETVAVTDKF